MSGEMRKYISQLEKNPEKEVQVIIRTADTAQKYVAQVETAGLTVTRTFSLIPGLAATGPARAVIKLAAEKWVATIEPDQPISALD